MGRHNTYEMLVASPMVVLELSIVIAASRVQIKE